jgi:hypothetical protein
MMYYYSMHVKLEYLQVAAEVVNPWFVGLSIASWIVVPALLEWLAFKRANLSGQPPAIHN